MNRRIALLASLVTISGIQANDPIITSTPTGDTVIINPQGFVSKTVDTLVYPFIWAKDTGTNVADFLTVNTLGRITGTSYLKGGLLDTNKLAIGRIALLAATIVAAQKAYNWYLAQQAANAASNSNFDFTFEPTSELGQ